MMRTEASFKEMGLWPVWVDRKPSVVESVRVDHQLVDRKFQVWCCDDVMFVIDGGAVTEDIKCFLMNLLQSFLGHEKVYLSFSEWREVSSAEAHNVGQVTVKRVFYMGEKGQFPFLTGGTLYQGPSLFDVLKTPSLKAQLWAGWGYLNDVESAGINTP